MSGGPKRNPDKLNQIGIVVVGICGAVLVYVSITALQAFYVSDTAELQTMADYGGNDMAIKKLKEEQQRSIREYGANPVAAAKPGEPPKERTFRIPVEEAMKLVVASAKADPTMLVPTQGPSTKPTIEALYGRPKPLAISPTSTTCDEASCATINFQGECCAKLKPPTDVPAAGSGAAPPPAGAPAPAAGAPAPAPGAASPAAAPKGHAPTHGAPAPAKGHAP